MDRNAEPTPASSYVGIDPSLCSTGLAVLDHRGDTIQTQRIEPRIKGAKLASRIEHLVTHVQAALIGVDAQPDHTAIAIEMPFWGSPKSAGKLYMVFGCLLLSLHCAGFERVYPFTTTQGKCFNANNGGAKKDEIRLAIYKRWEFEHSCNDVVEAYGFAHLARAIDHPKTYTTDEVAIADAVRDMKL